MPLSKAKLAAVGVREGVNQRDDEIWVVTSTSSSSFDLTVKSCWDQWTEEASFTQSSGSIRPRQTSHRDDRHITRHVRVEPSD
ncbi:hypothetical protein TNCV_964321 [Trichonephila clavipes]|nr:hypothetical protein TNCV_964321 [Trichonephila clavipes]